jgi:cysteinyl-tRNA synthetase
MSHYRSSLDFTEKALEAATNGLKKVQSFMARLNQKIKNSNSMGSAKLPIEDYKRSFEKAMNDDFNTPQALASVFDLINTINKVMDASDVPYSQDEWIGLKDVLKNTLEDVLGINLFQKDSRDDSHEDLEKVMKIILEIRADLREEKNFTLSDKIRDELKQYGITLKDTPEGAIWQKD